MCLRFLPIDRYNRISIKSDLPIFLAMRFRGFLIVIVCQARNIKTVAAFANRLAPKKSALFSLIYFFGSFCVYCIHSVLRFPEWCPIETWCMKLWFRTHLNSFHFSAQIFLLNVLIFKKLFLLGMLYLFFCFNVLAILGGQSI